MRPAAYAFDRSCRTTDADGRLHIALSNISKAAVNPYYGREIPDYEELGLDPDRVYQLLRDPDELAAGAATFNNLPVLSKHVPVSAEAPMQDLVIGSTGTDAAVQGGFLQNSAVVWVADEIRLILADEKKEWSCAYRYVADMTSGTYKGLRYDGIMRNIVGNHVALVKEGRAGPDVVVGDSKLETPDMAKALKTRTAVVLYGALAAYLAPKLAQDAKLDLKTPLAGVKRGFDTNKIVTAVTKATAGKLAQDADLADVVELIDAVKGVTDGEVDADMIETAAETAPGNTDPDDTPAVDADGDAIAKIMAFLKGKISDEDLAELAAMTGAGAADEDTRDAEEGPDKANDPKKLKGAMDAAVKTATKQFQALRIAEDAVRPIIGEVSRDITNPADVYQLAFDHLEIEYQGVDPSAYPAMLKLAQEARSTPAFALDAAASNLSDAETKFRKDNPTAARLIRS